MCFSLHIMSISTKGPPGLGLVASPLKAPLVLLPRFDGSQEIFEGVCSLGIEVSAPPSGRKREPDLRTVTLSLVAYQPGGSRFVMVTPNVELDAFGLITLPGLGGSQHPVNAGYTGVRLGMRTLIIDRRSGQGRTVISVKGTGLKFIEERTIS